MQLLQGVGDSFGVKPRVKLTKQLVANVEAWAGSEASRIAEVMGSRDRVLVAYAGAGYAVAAAHILYWLLAQLTPETPSSIHSVEELAYHLLAYKEYKGKPLIIVFGEEGSENNVARLSDAAKLTGVEFIVVSPPQPPIIRARLEASEDIVELPGPRYSIYAVMLALYTGLLYAKIVNPENPRVKRLVGELGNYASLLDDIEARYSSFITEAVELLKSQVNGLISYTPTMKPPAILLSRLAARYNMVLGIEPVSSTIVKVSQQRSIGRYLFLLRTDVEEDTIRELKFKISMLMPSNQPKIVELHLKTDPLTAPIYGSLVVEMIDDRLK